MKLFSQIATTLLGLLVGGMLLIAIGLVPYWDFLSKDSATFPALAIDEKVAVHFENERIKSIFSISDTAGLQHISKQNAALVSSTAVVQRIG